MGFKNRRILFRAKTISETAKKLTKKNVFKKSITIYE